MNLESIESYISVRTQMLMAVFNRKPSDELVAVFKEALRAYPMEALKAGFHKAETQCERFPTPKAMRDICNSSMPSQGRPEYRAAFGEDPETGERVEILIDPENGDRMYRPQHCPEGRNFLAKLREIAGRK